MNNQTATQKKIRLVADDVSITEVLKAMNVGQSVAFPASRFGSVRAITSSYGFQAGRKYATRTNRQNMTVEVTRMN